MYLNAVLNSIRSTIEKMHFFFYQNQSPPNGRISAPEGRLELNKFSAPLGAGRR